jgi:hypothetical protein
MVSLFIGSSVESLRVAYAIQENLQYNAEVTVWTQGLFDLSEVTVESLMNAASSFDFAAFVFSPDDVIRIRESNYRGVRDNVIFELGLFMGKLGRRRAFIISPAGVQDFHLPTDLLGVTRGTYDAGRTDGNLIAALGPACNRIREAIRRSDDEAKSASGLQYAHHCVAALPRRDWANTVRNCSRRVDLCGYTLYEVTDSTELLNALRDRALAGVQVRIVIQGPDNPATPYTVRSENLIPMRAQMVSSIERLVALRNSLPDGRQANVALSVLSGPGMVDLSLRFLDEELFVVPYMYGVPTPSSPVFVVSGAVTALYRAYSDIFLALFERGVTP